MSERAHKDLEAERTDAIMRCVLEHAAARDDELPEASPWFASRVQARVAAARARGLGEHPFGRLAWRLVPALALLCVTVGAWAGWETVAAHRASDDATISLVDPQVTADDVVWSGGADEAAPLEGDQ